MRCGGEKGVVVITALGLVAVGVVVTDKVAAMTQGRWETLAEGVTDLALLGSLTAAVGSAWLAWRLVLVLVRAPWTAVLLSLCCMMLPLVWRESHEGANRAIALYGSLEDPGHWHWVPGYWALILLLPVMALLAERLHVTGRARYALGHLGLLWLAGSLLLLQPDLALTVLLAWGALASAWLARPQGELRWLMALGMVLVSWWLVLAADARAILPWGLDFDPPLRAYLAETWNAAGWQGTGRLVTEPGELAQQPVHFSSIRSSCDPSCACP
jgi:cell division protein FtsW (lipid II flippase)